MAELGGMYRSELSGVLGGLTRVRAIQLNDAHIFCTLDQVADEARAALELIRRAYAALGIRAARYRLSLPGAGGKYVADAGDVAAGHRAADRGAGRARGCAYEAAEGEAAFYGPKIDVQVADAAGRESTLSTVQVDFHQPEQFGLHYIGADGAQAPAGHGPPQHHRQRGAGRRPPDRGARRRLPAWLAPVQLVVLPVSDAELPPAAAPPGAPSSGCGPRSPGRNAAPWAPASDPEACPYQAVIGAKEAADDLVALRLRDGRRLDPLPAAAQAGASGGG